MSDIALSRVLQPVPWDFKSFWALLSLFCTWGVLFALTWAHWGDLTIDCGREMYVAAELAQGRIIYSDLWYPYTPAGPYVNSVLFRLFGFHLSVLYWAGALAALGCAVLLFVTGLQLGSRIVAWTIGIVLLVQSFVPGIFCFPLPFSFGAVYGCLSACIFLWLIVNACSGIKSVWMLGAGITAGVALLMKQEIGAGCCATLALLVAIRGIGQRSLLRVAIDLGMLVPGCLLALGVIGWMVSLKGPQFLTQENLMSWPASYFMKRYGALWLAHTGLVISKTAVFKGIVSVSILIPFWLGLGWILDRYGERKWLLGAGSVVFMTVLILGIKYELPSRLIRILAFPRAAPFLVTLAVPVAAFLCSRTRFANPSCLQALMLFSMASCISLRILFRMQPVEYSIYYDGPVLLSYLMMLSGFLNRNGRSLRFRNPHTVMLPYLATLIPLTIWVLPLYKLNRQTAPLITDRGVIFTTPQKARAYRDVLDFIQHQPSGTSFLSVPEDVSLYFFAGIHCPTRVYAFTPGVLAPGEMTSSVIQEIERKKVRFLIWSNRTFEEYGSPTFGVDFDKALGDYFSTTYRPIRTIGDEAGAGWRAVIWERIIGIQTKPTNSDFIGGNVRSPIHDALPKVSKCPISQNTRSVSFGS
jgi:hypothetical protein